MLPPRFTPTRQLMGEVKAAKEEENADAQLDTDDAAAQRAHTLEQLATSVRELSASVQQVKGQLAAGKRRADE